MDLDDLPPPVVISGGRGEGPQTTNTAPPKQQQQQQQQQDEITDEDLMAWASGMYDDVISKSCDYHVIFIEPSSEPAAPKPKPRPLQPNAPPPQPKPRPPPPTASDGRIDLDAPEFDEFNLSDEDIAILASQMDSHSTTIVSNVVM